MTARHDDLDLNSDEDRAIYRQRVATEFSAMKFSVLKELAEQSDARDIGVYVQGGVPKVTSRYEAARTIANIRIRLLQAGKALWV